MSKTHTLAEIVLVVFMSMVVGINGSDTLFAAHERGSYHCSQECPSASSSSNIISTQGLDLEETKALLFDLCAWQKNEAPSFGSQTRCTFIPQKPQAPQAAYIRCDQGQGIACVTQIQCIYKNSAGADKMTFISSAKSFAAAEALARAEASHEFGDDMQFRCIREFQAIAP